MRNRGAHRTVPRRFDAVDLADFEAAVQHREFGDLYDAKSRLQGQVEP
jgi:hypothetical protein